MWIDDFSSSQLLVVVRDQAFYKTLFFAGDRAGDLGRVKTQGLLYFPRKERLLFNHVLTNTLRDGTSNLMSLTTQEIPHSPSHGY